MGIFSRLTKVLESNVNALLDKAEDPAKLLDQAIEDMKKGRAEAQQAIVEAKTQKRLLEKKRDKSLAEASEAERRAMLALKAGDEGLARKLLEAKLAADKRAQMDAEAAGSQDEQVAQLVIAEKELERRLAEMPAKRAALLTRQATAQAKGAHVGTSGRAQDSVSSALQAFERMEEKVLRAEVEAEVIPESRPMLLDTGALAQYETDDALAALKSKMTRELGAGTPKAKPAASEEPDSAVEDSLREMKAKLNK